MSDTIHIRDQRLRMGKADVPASVVAAMIAAVAPATFHGRTPGAFVVEKAGPQIGADVREALIALLTDGGATKVPKE